LVLVVEITPTEQILFCLLVTLLTLHYLQHWVVVLVDKTPVQLEVQVALVALVVEVVLEVV
jgi:hypothetical protein